jgi:thiamine biosynthesis lipoprotein
VRVDDPFGGEPIHELRLGEGAAATSGVGRRCWPGPDGRPTHHLLDPSSGEPAFTGIVQATALARTALLAETRAKAALLSGPGGAASWLPEGGVLVHDDGESEVVPAGRTQQPRLVAR